MLKMDRLRSAIGKHFVVKNEMVPDRTLTREGLMHFALSTGNLDPLYFDEDYAKASAQGQLVPPPTWYTEVMDPHVGCQALYTGLALAAVTYTDQAPIPAGDGDSGPPYYFLDGFRSFDGGIGFEYVEAPKLGEQFTLAGRVTDVIPKESKRLGPFAVLQGDLEYRSASDQLIVRGFASSLVYELDNVASDGQAAVEEREASATHECLVPPAEAIKGVQRRGAVPRYWEDVSEGESIGSLFKGTLDAAEIAVRSVKYGQNPRADAMIRQAWQLLDQGDGLSAVALYRGVASDPEFGFGVARHLDTSEATSEGAPGAYDIGTQRAAWAAQAVTDWMGDAGSMAAFSMKIRGFVVVGDSVWCKGKVAKKYVENDRHMVRLDIWVENQRAERVAIGAAEVSLPSRT